MVTTESLVDLVMSRWFFIELPNSSKSFLGLFSGFSDLCADERSLFDAAIAERSMRRT